MSILFCSLSSFSQLEVSGCHTNFLKFDYSVLQLRRTRDLSESRQPAKIINSGEIVIFLAAKMSKAKLQNSGEIVDFNGENVSKLSQKHTFKLS